MKRKNIVVPVLFVLAVAVWSFNVYRILTGGGSSGDDAENADLLSRDSIASSPSNRSAGFVYTESYRDPFLPVWSNPESSARTPPKKPVMPKAEKLKPIPPRLRFSGVVRDSAGCLAVVEGPDQETRFIREGEEIAGVIVKAIFPDHLQCTFEGDSLRLELIR